MDVLVTALSVAGGLLVGDALEVPVERLGDHRPLDRPWWRCPGCSAPATGLGLVPLARVLARRRGCPACGEPWPHPWRPAVLALVTAAVLGALAVRFGPDLALAPFAVLGISLVAISAADLEHLIVPNRMVYPAIFLLAPLLVAASAADHRWDLLVRAAIAGVAAPAAFYAVHWLYPRISRAGDQGMGLGDVRLSALVGLATGWLGLGHTFISFFAGFLLGSVGGALLILVGRLGLKAGMKLRIPFGPYMAAGALVGVLAGNPLANLLFHPATT